MTRFPTRFMRWRFMRWIEKLSRPPALPGRASGQRLVLGQMCVDAKTDEITAIPELVALLSLKGAIVTVDAIGCQKKIAKAIRSTGADYLLALKQNQETLHRAVVEFLEELRTCGFADCVAGRWQTLETTDADHGRLRTTNGLERINRELKRRSRVVSIFPNTAPCLRLVSALLAECDEEWMTGNI